MKDARKSTPDALFFIQPITLKASRIPNFPAAVAKGRAMG
jgi:hypothetical protein